jgi:hypothetical protein
MAAVDTAAMAMTTAAVVMVAVAKAAVAMTTAAVAMEVVAMAAVAVTMGAVATVAAAAMTATMVMTAAAVTVVVAAELTAIAATAKAMTTATTMVVTVTATAVGGKDIGSNSDGGWHRQQSTNIGSKDTVAVVTAKETAAAGAAMTAMGAQTTAPEVGTDGIAFTTAWEGCGCWL